MKKTISLILIILAVMTVLPACSSAAKTIDFPFLDVKTEEWYYDNVKYVFEKGIMKGTSDTSFSPAGSLSRAMCVTVLHRCAGEPETSEKTKFADVKSGEYYEKAVWWAADRGIVKGRSETEFAPDDPITRAEFATLMYRYLYDADLDLKETEKTYPADYSAIPSYAREAVAVMYRSGVLNGRENGQFDPNATITRAEAAAIIARFDNTAVPFVREDDCVLDIAFFGNSYVYVPQTFDHFSALAAGKHAVKIYNYTHAGWDLRDHYALWKEKCKDTEVKKEMRKWDVVLLNEGADWQNLGLREDFFRSYNEHIESLEKARDATPLQHDPSIPDYLSSTLFPDQVATQSDEPISFEEYYAHFYGGHPSAEYYKLLTELFGADKEYYNLCISSLKKTEEGDGITITEDGYWRIVTDEVVGDGEFEFYHYEPSNELSFLWRDWLRENCAVHRIMVNCAGFDPDHPLDPRDFDYEPRDYHPNLMYGYCSALALYCTIFDEPCIEQGRGILTYGDIPGDTSEEKAEYVTMIKNLIQEELDFQNTH